MTRYLTNPLGVFLTVWAIAIGSYLAGVTTDLFPPIRSSTVILISLNLLTFCLGYLTWSFFRGLKPPTGSLLSESARPLTAERIALALKYTGFMGLVALGLGFYRIYLVASYFGSDFFELLTHPNMLRLQLVLFIGANVFEISYIAMLISVASSFFAIGFVLLGIFLYTSCSRVRYIYLGGFLSISLVIGLTNLSRFEVTVHILYIVFAYCFMHAQTGRLRTRQVLLNLLIPFAAVAFLFAVIELLLDKGATFAQPDRLRGFLFSLYWYAASPLAAFNEFIGNFDGRYYFGQTMFFPIYKWLCRFDLVPATDFSIYGQMIFIPYPANVYTYLRNFYEDFGMAGIIVAPYMLGLLTCFVRSRAIRSFPYLNLYLVLLVFLLFSFYNYYLISNQIYMQVFFAFVFLRYELPDLHEPEPQA